MAQTATSKWEKSSSPQQLNVGITRCESEDELGLLVGSKMTHFDQINVATAFMKLSQLRGRGKQRLRDNAEAGDTTVILLASKGKLLENDFESHSITNILGALTKLYKKTAERNVQPCDDLVAALCRRSTVIAKTFTPSHVANSIWALSKLGPKAGSTMAMTQLCGHAINVREKFNARDVAVTIRALVSVAGKPGSIENRLLGAMYDQCLSVKDEFSPQDISSVLWALVRRPAKWGSAGIISALCSRAIGTADDFNAADISMTLWALHSLDFDPDTRLLDKLSSRIRTIPSSFSPQSLTVSLSTIAQSGWGVEDRAIAALMKTVAELQQPLDRRDALPLLWAIQVFNCLIPSVHAAVLAQHLPGVITDLQKRRHWLQHEQQAQAVTNGHGSSSQHPDRKGHGQGKADELLQLRRQLHQLLLACRLDSELAMHLPDTCLEPPFSSLRFPSSSAQVEIELSEIQHTLERLSLPCEGPVFDQPSGYTFDIVLPASSSLAPPAARFAPNGWLLFVDPPRDCHRARFGRGWRQSGYSQLRERQLRRLGYTVCTIPCFEWHAAARGGQEAMRQHLSAALGLGTGTSRRP